MSLIEVISSPLVAKDRMADSRPPPIPFTRTATFSVPIFFADAAIASATFEAAKGVAFFVPLKPMEPALAHDNIFPLVSVRVIIVLL